MNPRIALPQPTSTDFEYNRRNWAAYADAIRTCGGEPVEFALHLSPRAIAELANSCQAILLPGSPADVTPQKYGFEAEEGTAPPDPQRENVDELLLQDAHNLYKPILGVCFGAQMLNVWRSGTLIQDLTVMPINHAGSPAVIVSHTVVIAEGSLLASIVLEGGQPSAAHSDLRISVNSSHHQAIGIPGDGIRVSARCPQDGVAEAIEGGQGSFRHPLGTPAPEHFVLGLQWHPERTFNSDHISAAIFRRLISEAAQWSPRPIFTSVAGE